MILNTESDCGGDVEFEFATLVGSDASNAGHGWQFIPRNGPCNAFDVGTHQIPTRYRHPMQYGLCRGAIRFDGVLCIGSTCAGHVCPSLSDTRANAGRYDATLVHVKESICRKRNAIASFLLGTGSGFPRWWRHHKNGQQQQHHRRVATRATRLLQFAIRFEYGNLFPFNLKVLEHNYVFVQAWQLRFNHLVGYGAKYYSYLISRAVASWIWHTYFEADPFSRSQGERYRRECLAFGGGIPSKQLVANFLQRDVTAANLSHSLINELDINNSKLNAISCQHK